MEYLTLGSWIVAFIVMIGVILAFFRIFEKSKPSCGAPGAYSNSGCYLHSGIVTNCSHTRGTGCILYNNHDWNSLWKGNWIYNGVLTPLVWGLFLGLGYWTILQMIGWGLMGLTAGIFQVKLEENRYIRIGFGFARGFFYGWISNVTLTSVLGVYIASVPFDLCMELPM